MSRFLAIDPDADGLFVLAGVLTPSGPKVEQALALPPGPDGERPLTIARMADLGKRLKVALAEADIKPAPVLLVLGRDRVILKEVSYPPCPPVDEPALVRMQATRDLIEAVGDVVMDYTPIDPRSGSSLTGEAGVMKHAQVVIVRKEVIAAARELCEAAGLKLAGVTPRPHALAAALPDAEDTASAVAGTVLWEGGGEFVVRRGPELLYARTLSPAASQSEATFAGELRRNLTVYSGQRGAVPVGLLYVAESQRGGSAARLAQTLPVEVRTLDPLAGADAGGTSDAARGRFAALLGVMHLRARGPVLPINFTAPRQPRPEANSGPLKAVLAGLAALILFGVLGLLGYMKLDDADTTVAQLRADKTRLEGAVKATELDRNRLTAANEFTGRGVNWLDELYDMADRLDVKKSKVTVLDGEWVAPPKPTKAKPGAPKIDPKKEPPAPAAKLKVTVSTTETTDPLTGQLQADKFYTNTRPQVSPVSGGQVFEYTISVLPRTVADYLRRLTGTMPKAAPTPDEDDDTDPTGGF